MSFSPDSSEEQGFFGEPVVCLGYLVSSHLQELWSIRWGNVFTIYFCEPVLILLVNGHNTDPANCVAFSTLQIKKKETERKERTKKPNLARDTDLRIGPFLPLWLKFFFACSFKTFQTQDHFVCQGFFTFAILVFV